MSKRIKAYGVGDLARAAGVSVRTLHHYDAIGLLRPAGKAANGYRSYGRAEALRLQEILFYRAAGMRLADIAALLDGGDRLARLRAHRVLLVDEARAARARLQTLDATIAHLEGERDMALEELYKPFSARKQTEYEDWLIATYGPDMAEAIAASKVHMAAAPESMAERMAALRDIEAALVAVFARGGRADAALAAHRDWVADMWGRPCPPEAYAGLADMYLAHPDFIARYEALAPTFSQWLPAAMKDWAARR